MAIERNPKLSSFTIHIGGLALNERNVKALLADRNMWAEPDTWNAEVADALEEWFSDKEHMNLHTSGSTGTPKMIELSKESMITSALKTGEYFNANQGTKALLCLPARYIAGKMMLIRTMVLGWELYVQEPSSNPFEFPFETDFDFVAMTPHQLTHAYDASKEKLNSTKKILLGGSPITKDLERKILKLDPKIYLGYGMTETITHIAVRQLSGNHQSRVYKALKGVMFSVNSENNLTITADHIKASPIQTTDIVDLLTPTTFLWLGRGDHVINTGGIKVFPETIESKLASEIGDNFFIGALRNPELGQSVTLFIESNKAVNEKEIQYKINTLLLKYEKPKKIAVIPLFSYTPTGKINRQKTIERYLKQSDA